MLSNELVGVATEPSAGADARTGQAARRVIVSATEPLRSRSEPRSLVCADYDEIRDSRARMQQNHARWIAVLNTHLEANARFGGRLTERREHGDPLVCVPSKWLVLWNRMHDGQFRIARAAESQSLA